MTITLWNIYDSPRRYQDEQDNFAKGDVRMRQCFFFLRVLPIVFRAQISAVPLQPFDTRANLLSSAHCPIVLYPALSTPHPEKDTTGKGKNSIRHFFQCSTRCKAHTQ